MIKILIAIISNSSNTEELIYQINLTLAQVGNVEK